MPILKKAIVQNWRNIELQELEFSPNINCICGNNGEGKTNLLDAVYYLSMTKSAFGASDRFNFRKGTDTFGLSGTYDLENGSTTRISIQSKSGQDKKITRDGKAYPKISAHIGLIPIVMVSPSDTALVSEGGEERRRFVSGVLSQMDAVHLSDLQKYQKTLLSRNSLLKSQRIDDTVLESIDYTLGKLAAGICSTRTAFIDGLRPLVQKYYNELSSGKEDVDIIYKSDMQKGNLADLLARNIERDKLLGYTGVGAQRDDFIFLMNGDPIRKVGSQGQQKSFLVALKFAQYELMKGEYGFPPILLLDDLFDKLDFQRTENLLQMVSGEDFGQIFLSDTNKTRLQDIIDKLTVQSCYYEVKGGIFNNENR